MGQKTPKSKELGPKSDKIDPFSVSGAILPCFEPSERPGLYNLFWLVILPS